MSAFFIIVSFVIGFFVGVFERRVEGVKIKNPIKKSESPQAEILHTPDPEEVKKQSDKEFYDAIK